VLNAIDGSKIFITVQGVDQYEIGVNSDEGDQAPQQKAVMILLRKVKVKVTCLMIKHRFVKEIARFHAISQVLIFGP
jgi:hypothetical protein